MQTSPFWVLQNIQFKSYALRKFAAPTGFTERGHMAHMKPTNLAHKIQLTREVWSSKHIVPQDVVSA